MRATLTSRIYFALGWLFLAAVFAASASAEFIQTAPLIYLTEAGGTQSAKGFIFAGIVPVAGPVAGQELRSGLFIIWSDTSNFPPGVSTANLLAGGEEYGAQSLFLNYSRESNKFDGIYLPSGEVIDVPARMSVLLGNAGRLALTSGSAGLQYVTIVSLAGKEPSLLAFLGLQTAPVLKESGDKSVEILEAYLPPASELPYTVRDGVITRGSSQQSTLSFPSVSEDHPCLFQGAKYVFMRSEKLQALLNKQKKQETVSLSDLDTLSQESVNPADFIPLKVNRRLLLALGVSGGLYLIQEEGSLSYSSPLCLVDRLVLQ